MERILVAAILPSSSTTNLSSGVAIGPGIVPGDFRKDMMQAHSLLYLARSHFLVEKSANDRSMPVNPLIRFR